MLYEVIKVRERLHVKWAGIRIWESPNNEFFAVFWALNRMICSCHPFALHHVHTRGNSQVSLLLSHFQCHLIYEHVPNPERLSLLCLSTNTHMHSRMHCDNTAKTNSDTHHQIPLIISSVNFTSIAKNSDFNAYLPCVTVMSEFNLHSAGFWWHKVT